MNILTPVSEFCPTSEILNIHKTVCTSNMCFLVQEIKGSLSSPPAPGQKFICCNDQQDTGSQLVRHGAYTPISDLLKGSNIAASCCKATVDIADKLIGSVCSISISSHALIYSSR